MTFSRESPVSPEGSFMLPDTSMTIAAAMPSLDWIADAGVSCSSMRRSVRLERSSRFTSASHAFVAMAGVTAIAAVERRMPRLRPRVTASALAALGALLLL